MRRAPAESVSAPAAVSHPARKPRMVIAANAVPKEGGQGLNLQHMAEGLCESFELSIFCRTPASIAPTQVVPASRTEAIIGATPVLRRARDLQAHLSSTHFDHYVAAHLPVAELFQGVTGQCAFSLRAAWARGMRTVTDVVTAHVDEFCARAARECAAFGVRPPLSGATRRRMLDEYASADLIRVMSERARLTFLHRGFPEDRIVTVAPHIDLGEFPAADFAGPRFRVSFVGLIEPWKGFHHLVAAFNALRLPDSELVLWGGPGSRPVSRFLRDAMARNPAILVKPVEVRRIGYAEVYAKSSVLVHPSLTDGFGYAVLEGMASGLPVIVADGAGAADLVVDGCNGYVVPAGQSGPIAERLERLYHDPALVRRMGEAARRTAAELTLARFRELYIPRLLALCRGGSPLVGMPGISNSGTRNDGG
jgi:glycosyltransferase involved in cell wall biosynthesis